MAFDRVFPFFMRFMVSRLVPLFTMKNTKVLNETLTLLWIRTIEASRFFNELAHGIARSFMVDSPV